MPGGQASSTLVPCPSLAFVIPREVSDTLSWPVWGGWVSPSFQALLYLPRQPLQPLAPQLLEILIVILIQQTVGWDLT